MPTFCHILGEHLIHNEMTIDDKINFQGLYWLYLLSLLLSTMTSALLTYAVFSTHWEGSRCGNQNTFISDPGRPGSALWVPMFAHD